MKTKYLVAVGGGALAAIGTMVALPLPFIIEGVAALVAAGAVGSGLALVQSGNSVDNSAKAMLDRADAAKALLDPNASKLTREQQEAISKGVAKLKSIRDATDQIRSPNTSRQIRKICDIGDKIIQDFRDDPQDINHARTWLDVYLDQTLTLVQKYAHLSRTGARNLEAQRVLVEVERTLQVIENQSAELLQKLLHNDILGLDVSQQVIRDLVEREKM